MVIISIQQITKNIGTKVITCLLPIHIQCNTKHLIKTSEQFMTDFIFVFFTFFFADLFWTYHQPRDLRETILKAESDHQTADWITAAALEIASSADKTYFLAWPFVITVHLAPWRLQTPDMLWYCLGQRTIKRTKEMMVLVITDMCLLKQSLTLSGQHELHYD